MVQGEATCNFIPRPLEERRKGVVSTVSTFMQFLHGIYLCYLTSHTSAVCMCYLLPYGDYFLLHVLMFADQHKNAKFCAHKQYLTISEMKLHIVNMI